MKRKELTKGFCQDKKIQNARKTRKWVGGSNPNPDFFFFELLCLFVMFSCLQLFPKKWIGGWVGSDQSEFNKKYCSALMVNICLLIYLNSILHYLRVIASQINT